MRHAPAIALLLAPLALLAGCETTGGKSDCCPAGAPLADGAWMSWEGGVDLAGFTQPGLAQPNVIVHVARMVHTPVGSAPAGMILYQPDPKQPPVVAGFICADPAVGAYFGPHIFKGTPFEKAPVLPARIAVDTAAEGRASAKVGVGGHVFDVTLGGLAPLAQVQRPAGTGGMPFSQQGVEQAARRVVLKVDGKDVALTPAPGTVVAPTGVYAR